MRKHVLWATLCCAACGDDGVHHLPDAPVAPDAAPSDARTLTAEGFVSASLTSATGGGSPVFETYLHAWAPGTADPIGVFDAYYDRIGSAAALAIGECTPIVQPPFTPFASLSAGTAVTLTGGPAPVALDGPSVQGYYYGSKNAGATYAGPTLSITVGAGSEAIGGPGTLALGALPSITVGTEPQACTRSVDCVFDATIGQADLLYVTGALDTVCRIDPAAAPAVPKAAFATRPDGPGSVRIIAVRRGTVDLGGGHYQVFLATERAVSTNLSP
jgi:hypothetical protein